MEKKIGYCETAQCKRNNMPELIDDRKNKKIKEMERRDSDYRMCDNGFSCVKWMDKKPVYIASPLHDPSHLGTISRSQQDW